MQLYVELIMSKYLLISIRDENDKNFSSFFWNERIINTSCVILRVSAPVIYL